MSYLTSRRVTALVLACAVWLYGQSVASAEERTLRLELNKLEQRNEACRAYLVFQNEAENAYADFKLDLVLFDRAGVIANRLVVNVAPLHPHKTAVKLFDMAAASCADLSRVLVNEVTGCRDEAGEHADCVRRLRVGSRVDVELTM